MEVIIFLLGLGLFVYLLPYIITGIVAIIGVIAMIVAGIIALFSKKA